MGRLSKTECTYLPTYWMVRPSPTLMATVLGFLKVFSRRQAITESVAGVKHCSKTLIPDFHEDPENQVVLFRATPLLLSREFRVNHCSHEEPGHPGQSPLLGVRPLRGGVIPLWALVGVNIDRRGRNNGRR